MHSQSWHIVTGEYPPTPGGVSDYTQSVARALVRAGDEVHVWAPAPHGPLFEEPGIVLHALPDRFGPRSLVALSQGLARGSADAHAKKRVLLQYVPHAFGMHGMNLPFCAALAAFVARRDELWIMFHEVLVLMERGQPLRRNVLAATTHLMAAVLAYRGNALFASIPAWNELLKSRFPGVKTATWLPIPSNISGTPAPERVQALRASQSEEGRWDLVGHFGTYGALITPLLEQALVALLARHPRCKVLLLGRNGPRFAAELAERHPSLAIRERLTALGPLQDEDVAAHLAACDVVIQPFPDGISSRRTSVMASLALGVPIVSNEGWLTEPIWREADSVGLAAGPVVEKSADGGAEVMLQVAELAHALLSDRPRARALGERGRRLYERTFSLENTVRTLRNRAGSDMKQQHEAEAR